MYTRKEISYHNFGRYVVLSQRLAVPGQCVRFLKDVPMDANSVYTQSAGEHHHTIQSCRLGYVVSASETGVELSLKHRTRTLKNVPYEALEIMPSTHEEPGASTKLYVAEGYPQPSDPLTMAVNCEVRFLSPCPLDRKSNVVRSGDAPAYYLKNGTIATVVGFSDLCVNVRVAGRVKTVMGVPYSMVEVINLGSLGA